MFTIAHLARSLGYNTEQTVRRAFAGRVLGPHTHATGHSAGRRGRPPRYWRIRVTGGSVAGARRRPPTRDGDAATGPDGGRDRTRLTVLTHESPHRTPIAAHTAHRAAARTTRALPGAAAVGTGRGALAAGHSTCGTRAGGTAAPTRNRHAPRRPCSGARRRSQPCAPATHTYTTHHTTNCASASASHCWRLAASRARPLPPRHPPLPPRHTRLSINTHTTYRRTRPARPHPPPP